MLLCALLLFCVAFVFFYYNSFLPTSPDTVHLLIGVKGLTETGTLQPHIYESGGYSPDVDDASYVYPLTQLLIGATRLLSGLDVFFVLSAGISVMYGLFFLVAYIFSKEFFGARLYGFYSALLLSTSLLLARSLILTPQALIGYILSLSVMYFLMLFIKKDSQVFFYISVAALFSLGLFHHLTFFIILPVCLLVFIYAKKWKELSAVVALGVFGGLYLVFILGQSHVIHDVVSAVRNPVEDNIVNANSIIDLPAQIGYVIFVMGVFGMLFRHKALSARKHMLLLWSSVVLALLAYMHYIGIYFFPDRIVLYLVFPFTFFSISFLAYMRTHAAVSFNIAVGFLFAAHLFHFGSYAYDDMSFFTQKILPKKGEHSVYDFFGSQNSKTGVLTTYRGENKSSLFLPLFIDQGVTLLMSENFPLKNPQNMVLQERAMMLEFPDSHQAEELYEKYQISFVYVYKNTPENTLFKNSKRFIPVHESEVSVVYAYE